MSLLADIKMKEQGGDTMYICDDIRDQARNGAYPRIRNSCINTPWFITINNFTRVKRAKNRMFGVDGRKGRKTNGITCHVSELWSWGTGTLSIESEDVIQLKIEAWVMKATPDSDAMFLLSY